MANWQIVLCVLLILIIILCFFYAVSNTNKIGALCIVIIMISLGFICYFLIQKKLVLKLNNSDVEVINVSYYCPGCKQYIPSLEAKYCNRCGKDLQYIKKQIIGVKYGN